MRMRQTCVYIIVSSVFLSQGLAYADSSGSQRQNQQQGSSGNLVSESYSPPSGAKAGRDATLPDPTTNRKGGTTNEKGGIESYSPPSGAKVGRDATLPDPTTNRNEGIESYTPPSGAKAGRDATLPDPTTNRK